MKSRNDIKFFHIFGPVFALFLLMMVLYSPQQGMAQYYTKYSDPATQAIGSACYDLGKTEYECDQIINFFNDSKGTLACRLLPYYGISIAIAKPVISTLFSYNLPC
jgi:hypothetical protein